ncbi:MAG: NACHT domain-containing protein [Myxococcota bacterium]
MAVNWSNIDPNRPVEPGDPMYVERPTSASAGVVTRLQRGARVVLVTGPAGIGKSTELAHVGSKMQADYLPCLVQFDRAASMRTVTPDDALRLMVSALYRLSPGDSAGAHTLMSLTMSQFDLLLSRLRETTSSTGREVLFLLDGLEKSPASVAQGVFALLGDLVDEASFVVVVPWFATYGGLSQAVIHPSEKVAHLRPVTVEGEGATAGKNFLLKLLAQRIRGAVPTAAALKIIKVATVVSGGVPRTFLQIMTDAASRAAYERGEEWPNVDDLREAAEDMMDSYRRLLQQGDAAALKAVEDTDGMEMELDRKLRLLTHGILLEVEQGRQVKMRMHPLVRQLLSKV